MEGISPEEFVERIDEIASSFLEGLNLVVGQLEELTKRMEEVMENYENAD
jgi:hypothetical protein